MAAILSSRAAAPVHPDADPAGAALAPDIEAGEGADDPFLKVMDIAAQVRPARPQIDHGIGDPLARPVIGELAAAAGAVDREAAWLQQVALARAGASGIERGMLQQPDPAAGLARLHGRHMGLHGRHRFRVGLWAYR